jgi:ABC-type molybdate transport system substrate-binding protein
MKPSVCAVSIAGIAVALSLCGAVGAQETVKLFAAGSLRAALTEVGAAFTRAGGASVVGEFGASGLLRDRLAKAEALRPGAKDALAAKALQLTGGPNSPPPPNRNVYAMLVTERKADVFLTYCTNALAAQKENAALAIVAIPETLAVGASYGLTVMAGASPQAARFAQFVLGAEGQRILERHGFGAPAAR